MKDKKSLRTRYIHGTHRTKAWDFSHHVVPPMTTATTFRLESVARGAEGFVQFATGDTENPILVYDRLDEPNAMMLEEQIAALEGADIAVAFASGMAAISSLILSVAKSGDEILAHHTLYGCSHSLLSNWLPRFGIKTQFLDVNDLKDLESRITENTRLIYFETLSNPNLDLVDIKKLVALIQKLNKNREKKIFTAVDNTFPTPWVLRPHEFGIDFVIESLTKNISGFGVEMGGAIACKQEHVLNLKIARKDFGGIINPKAAWHIHVHGIPTLPIRIQQQTKTAIKVAEFLEGNSHVESVLYPGLQSYPQKDLAHEYLVDPEGQFCPGYMMSFSLKASEKVTRKFCDFIASQSYSITLAVSLGHTKTLIEVPGLMTHSGINEEGKAQAGIDKLLLRLSIGLESADDLITELKEALEHAFSK